MLIGIVPHQSGNSASSSDWLERSKDYARSYNTDAVSHLANEVKNYGYRIGLSALGGAQDEIDTPEEKIRSISAFAGDFLNSHWAGDFNALTAEEVATYMSHFNGASSDPNTFDFSHNVYNEGTLSAPIWRGHFDCRDMASIISGLALALDLPSRLVSVYYHYKDSSNRMHYQSHIFTEIYGITINNNGGWYVVDPAGQFGPIKVLTSETVSAMESYYSVFHQPNRNSNSNEYQRLRILWGIDSSGWGEDLPELLDQQISWILETTNNNYADPADVRNYISNPFGVTITDKLIFLTNPSISGPTSFTRSYQNFFFLGKDPEGENIRYIINWGDGSAETTVYYTEGIQITRGHYYGTYTTFKITLKTQKFVNGAYITSNEDFHWVSVSGNSGGGGPPGGPV